MPRAKAPRFNAQFVAWLEELKNEYNPEDNKYKLYKKALNGLREATKEFATPGDLIEVNGIGPAIIKTLEERYGSDTGLSQPRRAAPATRPLKRTNTDVDRDPPPHAKRRTVSAAASLLSAASTQPTRAIERPVTPFQFWYLDGDKRVRRRIDAGVVLSDQDGTLRMKVVYPLSQAGHPLAAVLYGPARQGNTIVAEMPEDIAESFPECPGFTEAPVPAPTRALTALLDEDKLQQRRLHNTIDPSRQLPGYLQKGTNPAAGSSRSNDVNLDMRQAAAARSYASLSHLSRASSPPASQTPPSTAASSSSSRLPPPRPLVRAATTTAAYSTEASCSSSISALHRTASAPAPAPFHARPRLSHAVPTLPPVEHPSIYAPQTTFPEFQPYVFRGGEYTVHLILDTGERKEKSDREGMADALRATRVPVERRKLNLGDVAWVAKDGNGQECMLDVVLERKRLDDLVTSIKDGRFHDQKFRLHRSGISRVLYLVEAYDARRQREAYGLAINTALSSTQVVDGFMVKETKNMPDTIAYLSGLTEELRRTHQTTNLYVIPTAQVRPHSFFDLQKHLRKTHPGMCFVTSFDDFQTLNAKSVFTTVRDTWARMLLCVKGMSPEKVGAVVEQWDTPRALWEAFRAAQIEEAQARAAEDVAPTGPDKGNGRKKKSAVPEARMMLQGVGGAEGGMRAIGPALSGKIYDLLMAVEYED
ncbi:ERCC4 domain-containing protein [Mycena belliarum]|uniref:Crossover junction endonuclease MUS81 n=1 Tax=Mycena belliarum TaxID=1033014 RepID=A0AAD6U3E9_9AGAR|nr:ERCC4 domain-containing protein [Mycena belliae]